MDKSSMPFIESNKKVVYLNNKFKIISGMTPLFFQENTSFFSIEDRFL